MPQSDDPYISAIRANDHAGLRNIYSEFSPSIIQLITRNGGSRDDARDVFQTALTVIYEKIKSGNLKLTGSFGGLLYAICRNLWGNHLTKKSTSEVSIPEHFKYTIAEDDDWDGTITQVERQKLLREKLNLLSTECRNLLQMFFAGHSMEEIKDALDMSSISYTGKRKFICKERLIKLVKEDVRFRELS